MKVFVLEQKQKPSPRRHEGHEVFNALSLINYFFLIQQQVISRDCCCISNCVGFKALLWSVCCARHTGRPECRRAVRALSRA